MRFYAGAIRGTADRQGKPAAACRDLTKLDLLREKL